MTMAKNKTENIVKERKYSEGEWREREGERGRERDREREGGGEKEKERERKREGGRDVLPSFYAV